MKFKTLLLVFFAMVFLSGSCVSKPDIEKPNIIFILADDMGIGDLACYDNPYIETPVIDKLARQGIKLTNCYATSSLCSSARGSVFTGRYNHRTGAIDVSSNRGIDRIALSEKTIGDYFKNAGYKTALIGKWQNGAYNNKYLPQNRGFDLFYGFANGHQDLRDWNLMRNGINEKSDGRYLPDVISQESVRFIQENKNNPFFLFISQISPHNAGKVPDSLIHKYNLKNDGSYSEDVVRLYAMIEAMDSGLGWIMEKLDELHLTQKTIIVFTSDHGGNMTGKFDRFKAGLAGGSGEVLEEGIKVPGIIVWPGSIKPGIKVDAPVTGIDWLPTLYSLTGDPAPDKALPLDGINLMPVFLQEKTIAMSDRFLYFQKNRYTPVAHSNAAIRAGKWKLYWPGVPETMKKDSRDNISLNRGKTNEHWEMPIDYELPGYENVVTLPPMLFNLEEDPSELHDVSAIHPEVADSLRILYKRWFDSVYADWKRSFDEIIAYDKMYWKNRQIPDPLDLYKEFRDSDRVKMNPGDDPLEVFRGYWDYNWD